MLLGEVRKVDEEPAAHIPLRGLNCLRPGWPVILDKKVAVFEQTTATNLFGISGGDQLLVQVVKRLVEVAINALAHHSRVEVVADVHSGAIVEEE